ncbi:MAG: sigma-E processing peptidase SpoIIGA [Eubacterium sp.]
MLFIINFFITFLLLEITAKLCKKDTKTFRIVLSSSVGGVYSFILLIDELPAYILIISKAVAAACMLLVAFKFYRVKSFFVALIVFVFTNLLFLGIIIGIYLISGTDLITINNSTVYFNIGARGLLVSAFFAYLISCLIVRIYNRSLSKGEIYTLVIENGNKEVTLFAFADTGNKLKEPFSNSPVIIADKKKIEPIMNEEKIRLIPASTVSGDTFLISFKPDKVTLKASNGKEVIEDVYVALSDEIKNGGFSAIINPEILSV